MMTGETEVIGEGLDPGSIWPPKITHGLARDGLPDKPLHAYALSVSFMEKES